MKKYILCLTIVAIQQASVVSQSINFYLTTDSVVYGGTAFQSFSATADIVNNGPDSVVVEAVRLINIIPVPPAWETAICVGGNCYPSIDTIWFTVHAGTAEQFLMYFRYQLHNIDTAHTYIQFESITPGIVFEQYQNFYGMDSLVLFTSVNEVESYKQINIYPTPATDKITISFAATTNESIAIKIYSIAGEVVYVEEKKSTAPITNYLPIAIGIPVTNLSNGIYFLSVQTEGEVMTKKIVVNH